MNQELFTSTEVRAILGGMAQRRLTNIREKIVKPEQDALGAGSRSLWSYVNLLEVALCETLFESGFQIYLVKKVLMDLRKDDEIEIWAKDFDAYFIELVKSFKRWHEVFGKEKDGRYPLIIDKDTTKYVSDSDLEDDSFILNQLKPKKPIGTLFYFFKEGGLGKKIIIPLGLKSSIGMGILEKDILESGRGFFVDLGMIKQKVDEGIKRGR